jgi:hypothetical protein
MESEYKLNLFNIMQTSTPSGRTSEDGEPAGDTILGLICDNWDKYEKITVLFEGIAEMTRPFMDEAFGKILETHSLDDFNKKLHFPDASDQIVKALNGAIKLRMKIISAAKERESSTDGF